MSTIEKLRLFTNLEEVWIGDARTYCSAVLLEQSPSRFNRDFKFKVRGFGPDWAWPVFDIFLKSADYTLAPARSAGVIIGDSGEAQPLAQGYIMQFVDGPKLDLIVRDANFRISTVNPEAPGICIDDFEGSQDEQPHRRVGAILPLRVQQFWRRGNAMPHLTWIPVSG